MAGIKKRGGLWHLRMRVPRRYHLVERRTEIHRSLKTDSKREALARLPAAEAAIMAELDTLLAAQQGGGARDVFASAVALAATRGMTYRTASEIAEGPLDEILARLDALHSNDSRHTVRALLGGIDPPRLMLSELVAEVERLAAHENRFKNENQMRLWRNPRLRAVQNLIAALGGDKPVLEIGPTEAMQHKRWWHKRIETEGQSAQTAGKDFSNLSGMLKRYYESLDLADPPRPYAGVAIRDRHALPSRKLEVPVEWIREKWLAPGALDKLNPEARDILLISVETGCRQSEIHDLPADAIVLDSKIPHLRLAFEGGNYKREIKNTASVRLVPLVGVALAAAQRHPGGFPRYRGKSSYSAAINKFLRENSLMPTPEHTAGGTRHTWESRLKAAGIDSDDRGEMMGHDVSSVRNRELYGDQMPLERKLELARGVALPVPPHLANIEE